MAFTKLTKDGKTISVRPGMVDFYEDQGWYKPGKVSVVHAEALEDVPSKVVPTIPEIRSWARENGIPDVPSRGKLPRHAIAAYNEAHN